MWITAISQIVKMVFIFLRQNGASEEERSRDRICSKLNEDIKIIFYLEKKQWRTIFIV